MNLNIEKEKRFKAIEMYKKGTGKKKIRTILKISRGKLDYWIRCYASKLHLKNTALKLYFKDNMGRYSICKKLQLDNREFDKWVTEYQNKLINKRHVDEVQEYKRDLVNKMYYKEGLGISKIVKDLGLKEDIVYKIINSKGNNINKQSGYSSWVSNIFKNPKII